MEDHLNFLLKQSSKFASDYGDGLSNHLPMGLIALQRLGATSQKMDSFFTRTAKSLELLKSNEYTEKIDQTNWQNFLGQHVNNSELIQFFEKEIQSLGIQKTLLKYLPHLQEGLAGAAFHPLIRLSYALDVNSDLEVSHALASWVMSNLPFQRPASTAEPKSIATTLENLKNNSKIQALQPVRNNIFSRLEAIHASDDFQNCVKDISYQNLFLEDLAELTIRTFLSSHNEFTALHTVTACHALRTVLPFLENPQDALESFLYAFLLAYVEMGLPTLVDSIIPDDIPNWDTVKNIALRSSDSHVIKFTYTCWQEAIFYSTTPQQASEFEREASSSFGKPGISALVPEGYKNDIYRFAAYKYIEQ